MTDFDSKQVKMPKKLSKNKNRKICKKQNNKIKFLI